MVVILMDIEWKCGEWSVVSPHKTRTNDRANLCPPPLHEVQRCSLHQHQVRKQQHLFVDVPDNSIDLMSLSCVGPLSAVDLLLGPDISLDGMTSIPLESESIMRVRPGYNSLGDQFPLSEI